MRRSEATVSERIRTFVRGLPRLLVDWLDLSVVSDARKLSVLTLLALAFTWYVAPSGSLLVEPSLLPWTALCSGILLALQGQRLGTGPHPQLPERSSPRGTYALKLASFLLPILLALVGGIAVREPWAHPDGADVAALLAFTDPTSLPALLLLGTALFAACAWTGRDEGRTAWRPTLAHPWRWRLRRALVVVGLVVAQFVVGLAGSRAVLDGLFHPAALPPWLAAHAGHVADHLACSLLAGSAFLLTGYVWDREQNHAQSEVMAARRRARGDQDWAKGGRRIYASGFLLPALGVLCLLSVLDTDGDQFLQAIGVAIYLAGAAASVWKLPRLHGLGVVLHEVVPVGEATASVSTGPGADATPPEGTLRFHPERVRRTGLALPWLVPAGSTLAASPLRAREPLWTPYLRPPLQHVLGDARIDDPDGREQVRRVRIEVLPGDDVAPLARGDNQERRLLVYSTRARRELRAERTWRWEREARTGHVRHVDPSTVSLELVEGDVIILGSGLLTQLYEIEIGAPLFELDSAATDAAPQFQDHEAP